MPIVLKKPEELVLLREAGRIVARCHEALREAVRPGVSTWELDQIAAKVLAKHGAKAAFLGYPPNSAHPFPATITASINNEIIHGIPRKDRILKEGDIISLDVGAIYKGYVGDAAFSMGVGKISSEAQRLLDVTEQALYEGIKAARKENTTADIAKAIQRYVEKHGYSVVREYSGHGVGRSLHEDPSVPNWWPKGRKIRATPLKVGMTLAIEPMVNIGKPHTKMLDDHWTVITADGSLSAHHEHSVAITDGEALILTVL
ncbi:MAG: type I methionyl aminopeptidase [Phototrophicales bacterium]|nr:MAG: type I methionyl aminopeptidase [Phototrophicales bacterium]